MANELSQTLQEAYITFHQTVEDYLAGMLMLTSPIVVSPSDYTYVEQRTYGQTVWEAHSPAPTEQDIKSEKHATTVLDKDSLVKVSIPDALRNPGLIVNEAANMGRLFGLTVARDFWGIVGALNGTSHPYTGRPVFSSAAVDCVDSYTIVPPNTTRAPSGSPFSQSNELDLAFSDTAVAAGIARRDGFFDLAGNPMKGDLGPDAQRPIMIGDADLRQEAEGIAGQMAPLYDGAGIQWGVRNMVESGFVIPLAGSGLAGKWLLWWRSITRGVQPGQRTMVGPVAPLFFYGPNVRFNEAEDTNYINIIGSGGYAIRISGDVDRDVIMSIP
jgi:hypothetical protein